MPGIRSLLPLALAALILTGAALPANAELAVRGEECSRTFALSEPLFKDWVRVNLGYGDIDGDGDIDIVSNTHSQVVALNQGNRLFTSSGIPTNYSHSSPLLAVHDLNNDGLGDLVYPYGVYFGQGGGAFSEMVSWWTEAARVVSFHGEAGLFTLRKDRENVSFVHLDRIKADGTLSSVSQIGLPSNNDLQAADFDGDGLTDIAAIRPLSIQIAWNLGGFRFALSSWFGTQQDHMGVADLNGDGASELVGLTRGRLSLVTFANRNITAKEISTGATVRGESGGPPFSQNGGPSFVGFDDRDGDGFKDLVFLGGDGFIVRWGAGDRPFETGSSYFSPGTGKARLLDLDGDRLLDIVPLSSYAVGPRVGWGTTGSRELGTPWDLSFETELSRDMVSRDFNGDGIADLMRTLLPRENQLRRDKSLNWGVDVLLGDGAGDFTQSFVFRSPHSSGSLGQAGQALAADLDRDGHLDLTVSTFGDWNGVHAQTDILLGNGDGTFRTSGLQAAELIPVAAGALRADGGDALVMRRDGTLFLMTVDSGAVVVEPVYDLVDDFRLAGVVPIDRDGDGRDEIVVAYEHQLQVLRRASSGWIVHPLESEFPGWLLNVHAADFTGDGARDLLITNSWGIILLDSNGTEYVESGLYAAIMQWSMVDDIDNDGDQDLLLIGVFDPVAAIHVYLNDGSGRFQRQDSIDVPDTSYYRQSDFLALIDVNGDGYKDLVTHYGEILLNRCRESNLRATAYPSPIWSGQEATLYFKGSQLLATARISRDGVPVAELSPDNSLHGGFTWSTGPLYTGTHTFDIVATGYNHQTPFTEGTRTVIEVLPEIPRRRTVRR